MIKKMGGKMSVEIRKIDENDTMNIVKWRNNPKVLCHFIDQRELSYDAHASWMQNYVNTGKVSQFIIVVDGQDVGSVFIRDIDHDKKIGEYGIFIGEDNFRGLGVGSKASRLILEYAFNSLGLNTIFLRVVESNVRAIKSYLNLGFKLSDRKEGNVLFMEMRKEK